LIATLTGLKISAIQGLLTPMTLSCRPTFSPDNNRIATTYKPLQWHPLSDPSHLRYPQRFHVIETHPWSARPWPHRQSTLEVFLGIGVYYEEEKEEEDHDNDEEGEEEEEEGG